MRTRCLLILFALALVSCGGRETLSGSSAIFIGNSMLYFGGIVQQGEQCCADSGMMHRTLAAGGYDVRVVDCTYGGHHLKDFTAAGCRWEDKHGPAGGPQKPSSGCPGVGTDLLGGLDLASFDYVFISEAGNNYESFYDDATAVFDRFRSVNPDVRCFYVNHIYSVYKKHDNVLSSLRRLHDEQGVTIINCGQLAYDIYTGAVKLPDGSPAFSDRYTFTNHTEKDTYHPNPLMGWIMTQMCWCALSGRAPMDGSIARECMYAGGSVPFGDYYGRYYTVEASTPFTAVMDSRAAMKGIASLIPDYIDRL